MNFAEKEFLPWCKKQHESHPATHTRYTVSAKPLIAYFGKLTLDAITCGDVERFKLNRGSNISAAGTNRDLAALRVMLNFAIQQEYLSRNPVSRVRFLPEGPGSIRIVSYEEQRRYLASASPTLRDVAVVMLETGMRPEEVFTIKRENVHLPKAYLLVPNGKTRFARRNIPLTDTASAVLQSRLIAAKGSYLFASRLDASEPLRTVQKLHMNALAKANIKPGFRLYDLRHSFGSRSAMAGVDLATLKELMGHSNISITMRYVHPTPEHKQIALQKLTHYNAEQVFVEFESHSQSPQESPQ